METNQTLQNLVTGQECAHGSSTGPNLESLARARENAYFAERERELIVKLKADAKTDQRK
jgi:hypothetical protein